jgi:pyruvate kinase
MAADTDTKIICTIGVSSESPTVLEQLVVTGMDIARLNFSHATFEQYVRVKTLLTRYNTMYHTAVTMMVDLQGPRMRVGELPAEGLELIQGSCVTFSTDSMDSDAIYISDPYLHQDVLPSHPLFLANGDMELRVTKVHEQQITAEVVRGGILHSRKGVNVPGTSLTTRGLTDKDRRDVAFAVEQQADYIAMSFVETGEDMNELRAVVNKSSIKTIAKIERQQAVQNLDSIIDASEILMVARGDLGAEIPVEEIPMLQKHIIRRARARGKPSIVATEMLLSMVDHPVPTRAEVSDVANAVLDGAWGVMLSDETAAGEFPIQATKYLAKTARYTKLSMDSHYSAAHVAL